MSNDNANNNDKMSEEELAAVTGGGLINDGPSTAIAKGLKPIYCQFCNTFLSITEYNDSSHLQKCKMNRISSL